MRATTGPKPMARPATSGKTVRRHDRLSIFPKTHFVTTRDRLKEAAEAIKLELEERRGFLAEWTARHNVPYADLTHAIHGAGVDKVYIQDNWHWNPAGHTIAARELQTLVHERLGRS